MVNTDVKQVHCGMFDSERFWRPDNLASMPSITDRAAKLIVDDMDELFFLYCAKNDVLLTKKKFNETLHQYLEALGYMFETVNFVDDSSVSDNVFQYGQINKEDRKKLHGKILSTFAVIPFIDKIANNYGMSFEVPTTEVVQVVNSKLFSNNVMNQLELNNYGVVVNSAEMLEEHGSRLLALGSILVKDIYGVSGKGNLAINSSVILERVVNHYKKQVSVYKKEIVLIIEPLLDKDKDFSCQFYIHRDGKFDFCSVQVLENAGFTYKRSMSADIEFMEFLERRRYFEVMESCSKILYQKGYYGDVCVDSMILNSGEIVPIVEINARKSMSLLKHFLDKKLNTYDVHGDFQHISFVSGKRINIEMLLDRLLKEDVLFTGEYGVMPLCANVLETNYKESVSGYKGRLYYSTVSNNMHNEELGEKLKEIMTELGVKKIM